MFGEVEIDVILVNENINNKISWWLLEKMGLLILEFGIVVVFLSKI